MAFVKALLAKGADVHARITLPPPRYGFVLFKAKYVMGATPFFLAANPFDGGYAVNGGTLSVAHIKAGHGVVPKGA